MELTRGRTVALAAAAACVALVAWLLLRDEWAEFDETVAALKAEGFATSPEEFVGEIPPEANGAVELQAALAWVDDHLGAESTWGVNGPWTPALQPEWPGPADAEEAAALTAFLERARPFFDRVDVALAKERFAFPVVRGPDGWVTLGSIRDLLRTEHLLSASARAAPDPSERIRSIGRLLRLAGRVEPGCLVDFVAATHPRTHGVAAIRAMLAERSTDPAEARAVLDPLLRQPSTSGSRRALRGEVAFGVDSARLYRAGRMPAGTAPPSATDRLRELARNPLGRDRRFPTPANGRADLNAMADAARLPTDDGAAIAAVFRRHASEGHSDVAETFAVVFDRFSRLDPERDLARLALAAAEFRETRGRWPPSFEDLAPLFPDGMPATAGEGRRFEMSERDGALELRNAAPRPPGPPAPDPWVVRVR